MIRDINFFAPYVKEQETSVAQVALTSVATVVLVGIAGTLGYNVFQTQSLDTKIATVNANLVEKTFVKNYEKAGDIALRKNMLQGFNTAIMTVYDGIIDRSIVDPVIMGQINSTVPAGVNITSLSLSNGTLTIQANSKSAGEAADFKYNIDNLPIIKKSFMNALSSDFDEVAEEYTFTINCTLQEG
ncbi:MAG: PilN domain-containing protein [Sarcina sp.]